MKTQATAESLDYKGILRLELFTGHQLLIDKEMVSAYIEIKIDGETKQSIETNKNDFSFGQVFHFHVNAGKRPREMQILICNINKGGYIQKNTVVKQYLGEIQLPINQAVDYRPQNLVKGRKIGVCCALTFLNNLFVQNIKGDIQLTLASMQPTKGILALSLGNHRTVYTGTAGTQLSVFNDSPYCKIVILYYENEQIKDYLGNKQVKLTKKPPSERKELFLCDLNWMQVDGTYKVVTDKLNFCNKTCVIRLQVQLFPHQVDKPIMQKIETEVQVKQFKRIMRIKSIQLIGFPYQVLQNPKLCVCFQTNLKRYFTSENDIPNWQTNLSFQECQIQAKLYDCLSKQAKEELAIIEGEQITLSKSFKDILKRFYAQNPSKYFELLDKQIDVIIEREYYSSKFTDCPMGVLSISQNDYQINDFIGQGSLITKYFDEYLSIRKIVGRQFIKQIDIPLYQIDFNSESINFENDQIKVYYEEDTNLKEEYVVYNYEKSNYAKITIVSIDIDKENADQIQVQLSANDINYKTSLIRGTYFGQNFVVNYPTKLFFSIIHFIEKEQMQYISQTYQALLDLNQLDLVSAQYINIQMQSNNKQCLLTIKVELSGYIDQFLNLTITPQCAVAPTQQGHYYIRVYDNFRCIQILNQSRQLSSALIFDQYMFKSDSLYKPFRMELCFSINKNQNDYSVIQELQLLALDLNWQQNNSYVYDLITLNIKREIDHTKQANKRTIKDNFDSYRLFMEFTLLNISYVQLQSDDVVVGYAIQLRHLGQDSVDRLKDHLNFQNNNQMYEYDRTELNTKYSPIITQMNKQDGQYSLIKLHQLGVMQNITYYYKILLGNIEPQNGIYYQELTDENGRPVIVKFKIKMIKHYRFNLNTNLELNVLALQTLKGKEVQINVVNLEDTKWLINSELPSQCQQTDCPAKFLIEEIESAIEFIIFKDQTLFQRHIIYLQQIPFDYDLQTGMGTYDLNLDGLKCVLQIQESQLPIESELNKKISINSLVKLKNFVGRFQQLKFNLNTEKYLFNQSLRFSFTTSNSLYAAQNLRRKNKYSKEQLQEYTLASLNSDTFPIYSSVESVYLGKKKLTLLSHLEHRLDDGETITQTDVSLSEIYICLNQNQDQDQDQTDIQLPFTYITKEGQTLNLDQSYIKYQKVQSPFQIGKFNLQFMRLLKGLMPEYQNKPVIDSAPIIVKLRYNRQKYTIQNITQTGLNEDGLFPQFEFFVSNIEDTMQIKIKIQEFVVAKGELCVAIADGYFIFHLPAFMYKEIDMLNHFHKKLQIKDLYLMGCIQFQKIEWVKVFIKLESIQISLSEEQNRNNYYTLIVQNQSYFWTSKVYTNDAKQFTIELEPSDVVEQLIDENSNAAYLQIVVKINSEPLAERFISLKPFVARKGKTMEFPIKMNESVTLNTIFEISQVFKSQFQQKIKTVKPVFDFRKSTYQEMLLEILNYKIEMVRGLSEFYEFLMYNLPTAYDPQLLMKIFKTIICVFNDKKKILSLSIQSMATIYTSHKNIMDKSMEDFIQQLLMIISDLLCVYDKEYVNKMQIPQMEEQLPAPIEQITDLTIESNILLAYLKHNTHKVFEDIFEDNQDQLAANIYVSILKIIDQYIYNNLKRSLKMMANLKLLIATYKYLDQFSDKLGVYFCMFINNLLNQYNDRDLENYLTQSQIQNIDTNNFEDLLIILLQNIQIASDKEFLTMLTTSNNIIKIIKSKKQQFLEISISSIIRSVNDYKQLEIHLGILIDYFNAENQNIIKEILKKIKLEPIALQVTQKEFLNLDESTSLTNLFDILIQSIELGVDQPYTKLQEFLQQSTPKQVFNRIPVEKFLLYMKRKEERLQRLKMMQDKQNSDKPKDINERKKQLMEKYMISKVNWK